MMKIAVKKLYVGYLTAIFNLSKSRNFWLIVVIYKKGKGDVYAKI